MIEIRLAEASDEGRGEIESTIFFRPLPDQASAAPGIGTRDRRAPGAADRRARPDRRAVRGLSARIALRFPGNDPEIGTIAAEHPPIVVITSNRTREIHDALSGAVSTIGSITRMPSARWKSSSASRPAAAPEAVARGRRLCAEFAQDGSVQAAGHRRDDRLTEALMQLDVLELTPNAIQRHAWRAAQVPGRHSPASRAARRRGCSTRSRPRSPPPRAKAEVVAIGPSPPTLRVGPSSSRKRAR